MINCQSNYLTNLCRIIDENEIEISRIEKTLEYYKSICDMLDSVKIENRTESKEKIKFIVKEISRKIKHKPIIDTSSCDSLKNTIKENSTKKQPRKVKHKSKEKQNVDLIPKNRLFIGIANIFSKNRKRKNSIKKKSKYIQVELESELRFIEGTIKRVTINDKDVVIKNIEEVVKKTKGVKVKNNTLISYFVLVKLKKKILKKGENTISVYSIDGKHSKKIFIER